MNEGFVSYFVQRADSASFLLPIDLKRASHVLLFPAVLAFLEVLLKDRPEDMEEAMTAMRSRPKMWSRVQKQFDQLAADNPVGTR